MENKCKSCGTDQKLIKEKPGFEKYQDYYCPNDFCMLNCDGEDSTGINSIFKIVIYDRASKMRYIAYTDQIKRIETTSKEEQISGPGSTCKFEVQTKLEFRNNINPRQGLSEIKDVLWTGITK